MSSLSGPWSYQAVVYDPKTGVVITIPIVAEDWNEAEAQARMLFGSDLRSVSVFG